VEQKAFYPIREASRLTQVPAHTLRYWERRLGLLAPTRIAGGQRRYTQTDLDTIFRIRELLTKQRFTLEGARKALLQTRRAPGADRNLPEAARAAVRAIREELEKVLADLERLT